MWIVGDDGLEVGDGADYRLGCGPAVVDVQGAAVPEHLVEVVVATEGVVPRQPVEKPRWIARQEGPEHRDRGLVGREHALRRDHALRGAG